jgi:hypothetical protein
VKPAYLFLPFPVLMLAFANEVFSSAGCGSSDDTDGGSACQPSCPDALLDTPVDTHAEAPAEDAGACHAACAKQIAFPGCPYPGCENACAIVTTRCIVANHEAAHAELLACEAHATKFTCTDTSGGILPTTDECADAAAAVAAECVTSDGGSEDGGAGACNAPVHGKTPTKAECETCCGDQFTEGFDTYNLALTNCACGTPGPCATPCAASLCAEMAPDAESSCAACVTKSLGPDGGCGSFVNNACIVDTNCVSYQNCLKTTCATLK